MKLKELLKIYYDLPSDVIMSNYRVVEGVFKELILPGAFRRIDEFRKTLSWNLDREVYYKEAYQETNDDTLYVTITTGKMDFYLTFGNREKFADILKLGLKKHRGYRKETLPLNGGTKFLFYSRHFE